eukprot:TRINITY_DN1750_c0_g3_i1.p1 TRINITY_DN1750_c0_g3~~TRINITY_DN1750_c0_g3_i1.p1  ORF type:complete len:1799 (-),score=315.51 TRINITY_DN1750_c0_g3_i1:39-5435(-)
MASPVAVSSPGKAGTGPGGQQPTTAELETHIALCDDIIKKYKAEGRLYDALQYMEKGLLLRKDLFGMKSDSVLAVSIDLATAYNTCAMSLLAQRRADAALSLLKKADMLTEPKGPLALNHDERTRLRSVTFNNVGCLYKKCGKLHAALQALEKALSLEVTFPAAARGSSKKGGGKSPRDVFSMYANRSGTHLNICAILSQLGQHESAYEHAQYAVELLEEGAEATGIDGNDVDGDGINDRSLMAVALHNIAVEQEALQMTTEALESYKAAADVALQQLGADHPTTKTVQASYKQALKNAKAPDAKTVRPGTAGSKGGKRPASSRQSKKRPQTAAPRHDRQPPAGLLYFNSRQGENVSRSRPNRVQSATTRSGHQSLASRKVASARAAGGTPRPSSAHEPTLSKAMNQGSDAAVLPRLDEQQKRPATARQRTHKAYASAAAHARFHDENQRRLIETQNQGDGASGAESVLFLPPPENGTVDGDALHRAMTERRQQQQQSQDQQQQQQQQQQPLPPQSGRGQSAGPRGQRTSAIMRQYDGLFSDVLNKANGGSVAEDKGVESDANIHGQLVSDASVSSRGGTSRGQNGAIYHSERNNNAASTRQMGTDHGNGQPVGVTDISITKSKSKKDKTMMSTFGGKSATSTRSRRRKGPPGRADYAWEHRPNPYEERNQPLAGEIRLGPTPPERVRHGQRQPAGVRATPADARPRPTPSRDWARWRDEGKLRRTAAHLLRGSLPKPIPQPDGTGDGGDPDAGDDAEDVWAVIAHPRESQRLELVLPARTPLEVEQAASTIQAAFRVYLARKWWWRQTKRRAMAKAKKENEGQGGQEEDDGSKEHVLKGMSKEELISLADSIMHKRAGSNRDRRSARAEHALIKIWQLGSARVRALAHSSVQRPRVIELPPTAGLVAIRSGARAHGTSLDRPNQDDGASDITGSDLEPDPRLAFRRGRPTRGGLRNGMESASDYGANENDSGDEIRRRTRIPSATPRSSSQPVWRRTAARKIIVGPQKPPEAEAHERHRPARPAVIRRIPIESRQAEEAVKEVPAMVSRILTVDGKINDLHTTWYAGMGPSNNVPPPVPRQMMAEGNAPLSPSENVALRSATQIPEGTGLTGPNREYWEHVEEFSRLASQQAAQQHKIHDASESDRQRMLRLRRERRAQKKSAAQEKAELLERTLAVVLIQRLFKGWVLRSRFQAKRESAVKIQAAVRGYLTRIHLFRAKHQAATKIQSAYRGYVDRKRVILIREDLAFRNASATKIQAIVRGMLVRRRWPQIKVDLVADKRKRWAAALTIQTVFRAYFCRKLLKEGLKAAVDIQRTWRGHVGREITREERRRHQAARDIQSVWRGHKTRRAVAVVRAAVAAEKKGALSLQRLFRGFVARRRVARLVERRTDAATRIQTSWRGQLARREVAVRRAKQVQRNEAAVQIQRVARGRIARSDYKRQLAEKRRREAAATAIQSGMRGMMGRKEGNRLRAQRKAKRDHAATQIQRSFRGKQGREFAQRLREASEKIMQIKPEVIGHVYVLKKQGKGPRVPKSNNPPPSNRGPRGRRAATRKQEDIGIPPALHFDAYMKDTMRLAHQVVVSVAEAERVLAAFSDLPIVDSATADTAGAQTADDNTKMRARDIRSLLYNSIDRADGVLDKMHTSSTQLGAGVPTDTSAIDAARESGTKDDGPSKLKASRRNPRTMAIIQTQQDYRARRNGAYTGPPGQIVEMQSQRQSIADELTSAIREQEEKERAARDERRAKEVARLDWQERQLREWKILSSTHTDANQPDAGGSARSQAIARVARERAEKR